MVRLSKVGLPTAAKRERMFLRIVKVFLSDALTLGDAISAVRRATSFGTKSGPTDETFSITVT